MYHNKASSLDNCFLCHVSENKNVMVKIPLSAQYTETEIIVIRSNTHILTYREQQDRNDLQKAITNFEFFAVSTCTCVYKNKISTAGMFF